MPGLDEMTGRPGNLMRISEKEFSQMRDLIYRKFGISLSNEKRALLVGRLQKILRSEGYGSFEEYHEYLNSRGNSGAFSRLIDSISTNHTYFNREKTHFDYFRQRAFPEILDELKKARSTDIRIWCAGCSSGEEPYMLLMLMREVLGSNHSRVDGGILATDISDRVLTMAREGVYSEERLRNLPADKRKKYFMKCGPDTYQVVESLRKEAVFRRFNLMNVSFPFKKPFQAIFCRNVMIYFDQITRDALVDKFHAATVPGGYLFIGHSETLGREQSLYEYVMPAVYRKK